MISEKKDGLWDNIRQKKARMKAGSGEKKAKPGDKDYPKTLNVEGKMKQARKNVGADSCWDGYKAKGTKKKGGKVVPNCVKEDEVSEELHPSVKRIDAMSKANVAKQAAKASADKSAREKSAAAFQAHM